MWIHPEQKHTHLGSKRSHLGPMKAILQENWTHLESMRTHRKQTWTHLSPMRAHLSPMRVHLEPMGAHRRLARARLGQVSGELCSNWFHLGAVASLWVVAGVRVVDGRGQGEGNRTVNIFFVRC